MKEVLLIFIVSSLLLIGLILLKPTVKVGQYTIALYVIAPILGALTMLCSGHISLNEVLAGLTAQSSINPVQILALFLSMTFMSIVLEEVGFFVYLANKVIALANSSQRLLFLSLYITVAILTIFTSNDIIILTFTPFIVYFARNAKINPLPYLIASFVTANTWSMFLVIGNPTNIYLATSAGINFFQYMTTMIVPTVASGIISFVFLFFIFRKSLDENMTITQVDTTLKDKPAVILCLSHLGVCILLMAASSLLHLQMWKISVGFFISLVLSITVLSAIRRKKPTYLVRAGKRMPLEIIPFIVSMFIMVLALTKTDLLTEASVYMANHNPVLSFGISSFIMSNVINNIPMSVVYSQLLSPLATSSAFFPATFASIIGSNVGALLTPVGALAGIMWTNMLKELDCHFSFVSFIKYAGSVGLVSMVTALITLNIVI
ncbi:ArsB/NhaD family transporter [Peptoniphilus equinus]|uniref:ArsB/NhaD family transporter n=1 Tax=Peptoniphilus equinus TaxID=3016343 RepID=A0ABY7QUU5_9FIRM|nr:SLC13 family permease [Peptoniphilus equinus]WBW50553.1 ArsB/NhaD family transporter [Peptoniphilus equinus]